MKEVSGKNRIGKTMIRMEEIKEEQKNLELEFAKLRKNMDSYFVEKNEEEFIFDDDEEQILSAKTYDQTRVIYSTEKIKEVLEPKLFQKVVDVDYKVDILKLKELIKSGIIDRAVVSKFVIKNELINPTKLENAYDQGLITAEQLKGRFESKVSKCFKISRKKRDDE